MYILLSWYCHLLRKQQSNSILSEKWNRNLFRPESILCAFQLIAQVNYLSGCLVHSINVEAEPLQESCIQSSATIITSGNSIYAGRVRAVAHTDISRLCTTWAMNLKAQMYLVSAVTHFQFPIQPNNHTIHRKYLLFAKLLPIRNFLSFPKNITA
jgi:hypothetical protein